MKKMNLYYIVSIAVLAVMMLIFFRTLKVMGWFERNIEKSPAEQTLQQIVGTFSLNSPDTVMHDKIRLLKINAIEVLEWGWLAVTLDTTTVYRIKINNFEDEQVLVEIFEVDSAGQDQRQDGCEMLLLADSSGTLIGSTLGEYCAYDENNDTYQAISLHMDEEIRFRIETRNFVDHSLINKTEYLLKRLDHDE